MLKKGSPRIAVLGLGNLLLKDDGIGVRLVQQLSGSVDTAVVHVIEGGTTLDILPLIGDGVEKLIIVDAVKAGDMPGTIYRFSLDEVGLGFEPPVSLHEIGALDSLKMMALFDRLPKSVVIIGIEPKEMDLGLELSPEVEEKLPELVRLVLREIEESNIAKEVSK